MLDNVDYVPGDMVRLMKFISPAGWVPVGDVGVIVSAVPVTRPDAHKFLLPDDTLYRVLFPNRGIDGPFLRSELKPFPVRYYGPPEALERFPSTAPVAT